MSKENKKVKILLLAVAGRLNESGEDAESEDIIKCFLKSFKKNVFCDDLIDCHLKIWNGADIPKKDSILYKKVNDLGLGNCTEIVTPKTIGLDDNTVEKVLSKRNSKIHGWVIDTINDFVYDNRNWEEFDLIASTDTDIFFTQSFGEKMQSFDVISNEFSPLFVGSNGNVRREINDIDNGKRFRLKPVKHPSPLKKEDKSNSRCIKDSEFEKFNRGRAHCKLFYHEEKPRMNPYFHLKDVKFWHNDNRITWYSGTYNLKKWKNVQRNSKLQMEIGGDTGCSAYYQVLNEMPDTKVLLLSEGDLPVDHFGKGVFNEEQEQSIIDWMNSRLE